MAPWRVKHRPGLSGPSQLSFRFELSAGRLSLHSVTAETFKPEIQEALKAYEKYVVCLDRTPEDCNASILSLLDKAIKAYENRGPGLRHGIALDKYLTVILSQSDSDLPFCAIYFNLHTPYHKRGVGKVAASKEKKKEQGDPHKS